VRRLLSPLFRPLSLTPSVTALLYSTTVCQALRDPLEGSTLWVNFAPASVMYG